jgi:hypothetical protein
MPLDMRAVRNMLNVANYHPVPNLVDYGILKGVGGVRCLPHPLPNPADTFHREPDCPRNWSAEHAVSGPLRFTRSRCPKAAAT